MQNIDQAISQVEALYKSLTGQDVPPPKKHVPIPPERDAEEYVAEQMDRLLGFFERSAGAVGFPAAAPTPRRQPDWSPTYSCWETAKEVVYQIDLPGVARDAIHVGAVETRLVVSGIRTPPWMAGTPAPAPASGAQAKKKPGADPAATLSTAVPQVSVRGGNQAFGYFECMFGLPPSAVSTSVNAELNKGVLEIRVSKSDQETSKRTITIK